MDENLQTMLVTLNCAPAMEEHLIDWLLERDAGTGFTGYTAFGHGSHHDHLSVAEQVSGRQRRVEFRVELPGQQVAPLIDALRAAFAGADVYFFVSPLVRSGHL